MSLFVCVYNRGFSNKIALDLQQTHDSEKLIVFFVVKWGSYLRGNADSSCAIYIA
jgi:hypothetical protein